ncbi:DUF2182 domain-containing protein [Nocardioides euryhalodurans]|uniref:DUF2182 domain-containing protein n=1 Tax=Nocardioides euryhalodurans TaxID=2518370 RepID=A0A4P7GHE6_9ACTN|nr:DUF2182 domain-containing protein [Nocardioides euryhalodurans]QBR91161.1 hypothetical protein EXE57_01920 [Nocardioides euryhalodurans]
MSASSWTDEAAAAPHRLTTWLAWRPEWPGVVVIAAAWLWLAVQSVQVPAGHHEHGASGLMGLGTWTVMCVAMMLPLALPALRHVAFNSFRGHRWSGMALLATGFLVPWVAFGVVAIAIGEWLLAGWMSSALLLAVLLVVAAGWQVSPPKRWAAFSCSRTVPLAPGGAREVGTRLEFGARQSLRCMGACWPLMAVMVVLPHGVVGLLAMAAATVGMVAEVTSRRRRTILPWLAAPLALAAVAAGLAVTW